MPRIIKEKQDHVVMLGPETIGFSNPFFHSCLACYAYRPTEGAWHLQKVKPHGQMRHGPQYAPLMSYIHILQREGYILPDYRLHNLLARYFFKYRAFPASPLPKQISNCSVSAILPPCPQRGEEDKSIHQKNSPVK